MLGVWVRPLPIHLRSSPIDTKLIKFDFPESSFRLSKLDIAKTKPRCVRNLSKREHRCHVRPMFLSTGVLLEASHRHSACLIKSQFYLSHFRLQQVLNTWPKHAQGISVTLHIRTMALCPALFRLRGRMLVAATDAQLLRMRVWRHKMNLGQSFQHELRDDRLCRI